MFILAGCGESRSDEAFEPPPAELVPGRISTVEDVFPATAVRGLVLNRCASCHSVACAALGQRSDDRWDEVEYSHQDYVPGLSIEDRGKIFDYLKRNFGADQPEPDVPAELLEGGCPRLEDEPASSAG